MFTFTFYAYTDIVLFLGLLVFLFLSVVLKQQPYLRSEAFVCSIHRLLVIVLVTVLAALLLTEGR